MTTWVSVRPGTSTPWKNPAVASSVVASSAAKRAQQRRLGQVALGDQRDVDAITQGRGGGVHRRPAREQGERSPAGCGDQGGELVVDGLAVARMARVGQRHRAVQQGVVGVVERTSDVGLSTVAGREPDALDQRRRDRGAGEDRRALLPDALAQQRPDVERGDLEVRVRPGCRRRSRPVRPPAAPTDRRGRRRCCRSPAPVISWARSLFCLASSICGSMASRASRARSSRPRASSSDLVEVVGVRDRQALADVRRRGRRGARRRRRRPRRSTSGSSRIRRRTAAERHEAARADLHAERRAHDVLEPVGLVEHDDVVLGQDRPAGRRRARP